MIAELIFFILVGGCLLFGRKKGRIFDCISHPLYISLFFMGISVFGFTPAFLQYSIRAGAVLFSIICIIASAESIKIINKKIAIIVIVYLVYCFISTFYSVDPIQTLFKSVELAVDFLLISAIIRHERDYELAISHMFEVMFRIAILAVIYILIGTIFDHNSFLHSSKGALGFQLSGGVMSANTVGNICSIAVIFLLNKRDLKRRYFLFALVFVELLLCQARSSIIVVVAVLLLYYYKSKYKFIYLIAGAGACFSVWRFHDIIYKYFIRGSTEENMLNMSGRRTMWNVAQNYIEKKPILGYGFGAGGEMISQKMFGMSTLHSGIYECLVGLGYIGFALLVVMYISVAILLIRSIISHGFANNVQRMMLFVYLSIRTYISIGIGGWHSIEMLIWFILLYDLSTQKNVSHGVKEIERIYE